MKLLKNDLYLLLIDEEAEIKRGDYLLEKESIINVFPDYLTDLEECAKIIAYRKLNEEAKELDLPLLPVTPKDKWGVHETHCCEKCGCKYGDNDCCVAIGIAKAKYPCEYCDDDENDKQFSLEDIKKALHFGEALSRYFGTHKAKERESFIQSLSTQQLPKEFIPEYEDYDIIENTLFSSKVRKDLKTITNSEGKEVLVGTWKY